VIYVGLDDTDNLTSRGTGRLARAIAEVLSQRYRVTGITRHQLLVDPRVPYTKHNSSAAIHLDADGEVDLQVLADEVQALMLADWQEGSDPGLCVSGTVVREVSEFGQRAKKEVVSRSEAYDLAARVGCVLRGLGGTDDGVIGALAAVGLAGTGSDGRFILVGSARELQGVQPVEKVLASGIAEVCRADGQRLEAGLIDTGGKLRPALRNGRPVLVVQPENDAQDLWLPLKLD
jgi:hypothetical protein